MPGGVSGVGDSQQPKVAGKTLVDQCGAQQSLGSFPVGTVRHHEELNLHPPMMPGGLERQLPLVMVEVLGAVVVDVEHAHGGVEIGVPGGREVHDQVQAVVGFDGELAL